MPFNYRHNNMAKFYVGWEADVPAPDRMRKHSMAPLSVRLAATGDRPASSTPFWLRRLGDEDIAQAGDTSENQN